MVVEDDATAARVDLPLLKAVARARRWSQDLISGRVQSVSELARWEELDRRSVHRLLRLGFLSPRIVEKIAEGRRTSTRSVSSVGSISSCSGARRNRNSAPANSRPARHARHGGLGALARRG